MPFPEFTLPPVSRPFETLDWLPVKLLYGSNDPTEFPASYNYGAFPPSSDYGPNTSFPTECDAKSMARIYWKPQRYIVARATLTCVAYGTITMTIPVVSDSYRPNPEPDEIIMEREAVEAFQLLSPPLENVFNKGVGGRVIRRNMPFIGSGTAGTVGVKMSVDFSIRPLVAMSGEEPLRVFAPLIFASVIVGEDVSGGQSRASTAEGPETDFNYPQVCGRALICYDENIPSGAVAPLFTTISKSNADHTHDVTSAEMVIDFAPWAFAD